MRCGWVRARLVALAVTIGILCAPCGPAVALDPDRAIGQYKLTPWRPEAGAPAVIFRLAQDPTGFLWMATTEGLYRFDGITFEHIPAPLPRSVRQIALPLLVSRKGEVWVWYRAASRLGVYRNGAIQLFPPPPVAGYGNWLAEGGDGAMWVGLNNYGAPLLRFKDGRWRAFGPRQGVPNGYLAKLMSHPDGSIWASFGTPSMVVRLPNGKDRFELVRTVPSGTFLLMDRHQRVWVNTRIGTIPLSNPGGHRLTSPIPPTLPAGGRTRAMPLILDRDDNLWVSDYNHGLRRTRPDGRAPLRPGADAPEHFSSKDGLTSDIINDLYEDREGNIWAAGTFGLNQFSNAAVVAVPGLNQPGSLGDIVRSGRDGTVYIGERDALWRVRPGQEPERWASQAKNARAICEMPDGSLFVAASPRYIRIFRDGRIASIEPPRIRPGLVRNCAVDREGTLWLAAVGEGWFRYKGTSWQQVARPTVPLDLAQLLADPRGGVLISPSETSVVRVGTAAGPQTVLAPDPRVGAIIALFRINAGVLVRGMNGMALLGPNGTRFLTFEQAPSFKGLNGLVELPDGTSWGYGHAGIIRFRSADLAKAFAAPSRPIPVKILNFNDGLTAPSPTIIPQAAAAGSDGRIWFSTDPIVMMVDSRRVSVNPLAPGLKITAMIADGVRTRDPALLHLRAGSRDLQINFSALSLSKPRSVQIRYRLEGYDDAWVDPGLRREAFYTNLSPGTYRFRVIAANEDGVWNRNGATLEFTIPPTFLQSIWFKLLLVLVAAALATLAYRLRLRQLTAQMQSQFNARIAERERIARELHDTLLQGIQGLMLRFQAAMDQVSAPKVREVLDDALERADEVLIEGRARVRDLRSGPDSGELADRLRTLASRLVEGDTPRVDLILEGARRPLKSLVLEEALRIAEESIRNVALHAKATRLDLLIDYGAKEFCLRIRDDGVGIPQDVLSSGKRANHFGLVGMRERAQQIGGRLSITSAEGAGTEVTLKVRARSAYPRRRWWKLPFLATDGPQDP